MSNSDTNIIPNLMRSSGGIKLVSKVATPKGDRKPEVSSPVNAVRAADIKPLVKMRDIRTPTGGNTSQVSSPVNRELVGAAESVKMKTPISSREITPVGQMNVKPKTPISSREITPVGALNIKPKTPVARQDNNPKTPKNNITVVVNVPKKTTISSAPISESSEPKQKHKKSATYTDAQLNFMLEGYNKLNESLWTLLRPGDEVSYFKHGNRNENFIRGGFVKYCNRGCIGIEFVRGGKKENGNLEYRVSIKNIAELWMKTRK